MTSSNTLCRLCGKNTKDYIDIFDENGVQKDLGVKASSCLNINVHPNDVLPKIMCVTCCARLDDLYEFFERSTKVQLILRTLYQSNGAMSVVRAEHDYAIKVPTGNGFPIVENLAKEEYTPTPICVDEEPERLRPDGGYENCNAKRNGEGENMAEHQLFALESVQHENFNNEAEHNYFLPLPESRENRNSMDVNQETEHNYYVRLDRLLENRNRPDSIREIELDDAFQDPTLTHILDGYPWSCTIDDDIHTNSRSFSLQATT